MGCIAATNRVQPSQLENHIDSYDTADGHVSAALLYEQRAERARAEATQYEREASAINPIEDPKGFRRNALITAAKERQQEAADMQRLFLVHQTKAQTMTGQQSR